MEEEMDWTPPVPEGWNDGNRAFLQAFMARGTLTLGEAQPVLADILNASRGPDEARIDPESVTLRQFEEFVNIAREAVSPLDFDIRSSLHQVRKERVWAFINSHSDPATELATIHEPDEISFIRRMLDAMFETYNTRRMEVMCVTEQQALKVSRPPRNRGSAVGDPRPAEEGEGGEDQTQQSGNKGLKHSEVMALLASLVAEGWLEKSRNGFYSLTPRSLLELGPWLIASYNDEDADADAWQRIKTCEACREIITVGQRCADRDCNVRLHDICEEAYMRSRRDKKCPKCMTPWDGKHYVGEKAVTQTEAFQRSRERGGARPSDVIDQLMAPDEDEEEEQGEEEEEEEEEEQEEQEDEDVAMEE